MSADQNIIFTDQKIINADQKIICAEHAWCQEFLKKKQQQLNSLTDKNVIVPKMTLRRKRFDCRTREAKLQQEVFKIYEPLLLELDAKLSSRIALTHVSSEILTQPTHFQKLCASQVKQQFIDTIGGKDVFDKLERRLNVVDHVGNKV
jgi:hypothetical protein